MNQIYWATGIKQLHINKKIEMLFSETKKVHIKFSTFWH